MIKRNMVRMLMIIAIVAMIFPVATQAQKDDLAGNENFIFVNYIGQEMTFDLDDITYTIPGTATVPDGGRLTLVLPAGEHKFAANVPSVEGSAGEFTLASGEVVARAARLEQSSPVLDKNGVLLKEPTDHVSVFNFDPFAVPVDPVPVVDSWLPSVAAVGQSSLAWTNYSRDELTVDLNGQLYKIPPPAGEIPGRLQIDVLPGEYTYTASVPNGSINGQITAVAGQVTGFNITADLPPEPDYDVGEAFDINPPVTLRLFEENLTEQATTAAAAQPAVPADSPATLPSTGNAVTPAMPETPVTTTDGLLIKNYAGDTLVFTINNQAYHILHNTEQTLDLPPGQYSYTASIPFVATTGIVNLSAGQSVALSIATNVNHNILNVYQN